MLNQTDLWLNTVSVTDTRCQSVHALDILWLLTHVEEKIDQLASLEKKIDNITSILTNNSVSHLNPCTKVHDGTQLYSNKVVDDSTSTLSLELS